MSFQTLPSLLTSSYDFDEPTDSTLGPLYHYVMKFYVDQGSY